MERVQLWINAIANDPQQGIVLLLLLGFSLYGFERFLRLQSRRRLIQDTPTSRIRSAAQGYVELEGFAENSPASPIFSTLTHTACTWYRYKVEERSTNNNGQTEWKTIRSGTSPHLFVLDDNTGKCVIDPERAVVEPAHKRVWQTGDLRYTEELILPLEQLYALGWLKSYEAPQTSLNDWERDTVIAWKTDPAIRQRYDVNKDGHLSESEFAALRKDAKATAIQAQQADLHERSKEGQTHMLNAGDPQGRPLILSTHPQQTLAARLHRQAWLWLAGGLIGLGSLVYILTETLPSTT